MNGKIIAGIVVLVLGVVLIGILCGLGGYAKGAVDEGVKTRLEYELPEGYKTNPNFEQCYKSTVALFDEEYYLWNLTNLDEVLAGGRAQFNLTGPFSYTEEYCEYDHSINEETGLLQYKEYSNGYHYLPGSSVSSTDDDVFITNVNPGYLAVLSSLGGDDSSLAGAFVGGALEKIITDLQSAVPLVWLTTLPPVLAKVNDQTNRLMVFEAFAIDINGVSEADFFSPGFITTNRSLDGFTTFTNVTLGNSTGLWATYRNNVNHVAFSTLNASAIMQIYGFNETEANAAIAYDVYLFNALRDLAPEQWANAANPSFHYYRWEIGYPERTNISTEDVLRLWDPQFVCSLVNPTSYQATWLAALQTQDLSFITCPGLTITVAQKLRVLQYLQTFSATKVKEFLESQLDFSDWSSFGYAQWGQFILGRTLSKDPAQFVPEINRDGSAATKYEVAQAKSLLNGTYGLFRLENVQLFNTLYAQQASGNTTARDLIFTYWDAIGDASRLTSLAIYIRFNLIPGAVDPLLNQIRAAGGGMFTTRSVREWLFTARDPLLALVRPARANVGLVGNSTSAKETANYTYVRVYTGKNDLYWSLMPTNDGEKLDFWCGDVSVTGFNGSQFLPNGYVDKPKQFEKYPLNLYHKKITRPIPFQNKGKFKWGDINTRYLTMADDALASENINNLNAAYCQKHSGAVNKTSNPPLLPLFLTTPNFYSADEIFYKDINFTDLIYAPTYDKDDKFSLHRLSLFILVEPKLGSAVWGNLPIQANFQYGKTTAYPNVVNAFAPIYWNAIGDKATPDDLHTIETDLYANQRAWKILIGVGVGVGVSLVIAGIVMIVHFKKHEFELKD